MKGRSLADFITIGLVAGGVLGTLLLALADGEAVGGLEQATKPKPPTLAKAPNRWRRWRCTEREVGVVGILDVF